MGLYEVLKKHSILEPVVKDLMKMSLVMNADEKVVNGPFSVPTFENPWIYSGTESGRNCYLWRDIYLFKYGLISRNCLNCWKITMRPNHLSDLVKINKLQIEMHKESSKRYNAKCGMEKRPWCTYKGRYAAFWYVPMYNKDPLALGRKIVKEVDGRVKALGIATRVVLKRGCTELEEKHGPSNEWEYPKEYHALEDELDSFYHVEPKVEAKQPEALKSLILTKWIEHAFQTGDPTVKEFVDSYPGSFGIRPTVDYYKDNPTLMPKSNPEKGRLPHAKSEGKGKTEGSETEQPRLLKL